MKMTTSDFEQLKAGLHATVSELNVRPSDVGSEREMWNVLHLSRQQGRVDLIALYRDYNDAHILTAMRQIFREDNR
jgi:hypothetical protein